MTDKKRVSVSIRPELYKRLTEAAKEDKRSLPNFVSWILYTWAEAEGNAPKKRRRENLMGLKVLNGEKGA